MKQYYQRTFFLRKAWCLLLLLFIGVSGIFAQNLVETEPNNAFGDAGIQEIFDRESLWGETANNPFFGSPDPIDIWHITPTSGTDRYLYHSYQGAKVFSSPAGAFTTPDVWLVTRNGGHNGTMVSQVKLVNSVTSRYLLDYTGTNYYYSIEVRGNDGLYNAQPIFDARITVRSNSTTFCQDPNSVTAISSTSSKNAISLNAITVPAGGATGYMVKISDTNSFTDQMDNFDVLPTADTAYSGTGEQVVYSGTSANPNISITGLTNETEYYVKAYAYTLCDGDFYFYNNAGSSIPVQTCVAPTAPVANITFGNETNSTINLSSFDAALDAEGYIIKVNTVNSFTNLGTVSTLPSTNTIYNGSGEQIVYAGTANNPDITITGLNASTEYFVKVYGYNECLSNFYIENTGATASSTTCGSPTDGQINLTANNAAKTEASVQVQQTKPATVSGVLVYINTTNSFTAPTDGNTLPTANAVYSGSGQQVVASSTLANSSVAITSLNPNTTYYFKAYGYNSCADGTYFFETTGTSHSDTTCGITTNTVSNEVISSVKMNALSIDSFDAPVADTFGNDPTGYVVVMNTTNTFTPLTTSVSLPTANAVYASGQQVVYAGTSNTPNVAVSGLTENTEYYVTIYAYKQCDTNIYFQQTGYSFTQKTEAITTNLASTVVVSNVVKESLQLDSFTAAATDASAVDITGYVIKMNTSNTFTPIGSGNMLPVANAVYISGEQVIYAGTSNTPNLSITGLTENTTYYFTINGYALQDGIYNYQSTGYTFSQTTLTINFTTPSLIFGGADVTLSGNASSSGVVSFSLVDDPTTSSISGDMFTIGNAGDTTVRVSAAANGVYGADSKDFPVTINRINPVITWSPVSSSILINVPLDASYLNAVANTPGTFEYYENYSSFYKVYSGRITAGVTALTYAGPRTIYARFIPADVNYNIVPASIAITVTAAPKMVDITPVDATKALGSADPTLTSALTGGVLAFGDKMWVPLKREPGETVGTYVISIDQTAQAPASFDPSGVCTTGICILTPDLDPFGEGGDILGTSNYTIQTNTGTFTIADKEQVTITLDPFKVRNRYYTGSPFIPVTVSNMVVTGTANPPAPAPTVNMVYAGNDQLGGSYGPSITPPTNAGTYTVTGSIDATDPNYFGTATGSFTIYQSGIVTFTASNAQVKKYDGTPKTFEVTATGELGESLPIIVNYDIDPGAGTLYSEAPQVAVGTYPVRVRTSFAMNYNSEYTGTLTITDKTIVTINLAGLTQPYTGTPKSVTVSSIETSPGVAATPTPVVDITYEGINGTFYTKQSTPPTNGGQYRVIAEVDAADPNFTGTGSETLRITLKERVTFNFDTSDLSKTYNGSGQGVTIINVTDSDDVVITPGYTFVYSGTDADDNAYGPSPVAPTNAGDYTITATVSPFDTTYQGSGSENFSISRIALTLIAEAKSKVYGDADPTLTYQVTSGSLIGSDAITGNLARANGEDVGTYTINKGTLTAGVNYGITYTSADFEITKADQTISFDALTTVTYGDASFNLTATASSGFDITYISSNTSVATVSGNTVTIVGAGSATITASQAGNINYNAATNIDQVLTVKRKDLSVFPVVTTVEYGLIIDTSGTVPVMATGFVNGDDINTLTPSGLPYRVDYYDNTIPGFVARDVGIYPNGARIFDVADPYEYHPNYKYVFTAAPVEIVPLEVTITGDVNQTKTFGDADPTLAYTVTPLPVNGAEKAYNHSAFALSGSLERVSGENVGTYAINQGTLALTTANYTINFVANDFEITARAIEITVDAKSKIYGNADPALTYQITSGSLAGSDTFRGVLTRASGENAGTYAIRQGTLAVDANYAISFISNDLTITTRTIEVTADAKTKTYGDADPALTYQITSGSLAGSDTFAGAIARVTGQAQGNYVINQGTLTLGANYDLSFVNGNLYIDYRFIRIIPSAIQKIYGNPDPAFSVPFAITIGSLAYDDAVVVTGSSRDLGENVGGYQIRGLRTQFTSTNGGQSSYSVSFMNAPSARLNIRSRDIQVTADAQSKVYGDTDPVLSYQVTNGALQFSDAFTGSLTRVTGENLGTYVINQGTLSTGSNYTLSYVSDDLTIGQRAIEITADAKSKTYGDIDPAFTYQITSGSLVGSDAFTGNLTRVAGETIGTYAINQGDLALDSNYNITYISDNFSIAPADVIVTAIAKSKIYGDSDPALTYTVTTGSAIGSDAFTGSLARVSGENVGTYAINQGTLVVDSNYALTFVSNDLTIGQRTIEVTADAQTKTYGDADPALTYQITNGSLTGSDAFTGNLERITGENVGAYAINQGSLALNSNYTLSYIGNDVTITPRRIGVIADPKSKVYGDADPTLTAAVYLGSLVNGDVLTGSLIRDPGEDVGFYPIRQGTVVVNGNYDIEFRSENLNITPRAIQVTADVQHKTYGDADPTLTYQITNGALQFSDTFSGSITRATGEAVGAYTINQGTVALNSNYSLSYISNDLTIGQRAITITADSHVKVIGAADPTLTYRITSGGLQFSDTVTGNLTRVTGETLGDYAINQGSLSVGGNYNLTFIPGTLTITNLIPQVITFGTLTDRSFGDAAFVLAATGGASGNPITFVSSNTAVATISGNTVTIVGVGTTTITASQTGNTTYAAAIDVPQVLNVNKGNQTITFAPLADVSVEAPTFSLNATATSGLGVTYTSSNPAVATVSGSVISIVGIGTTTITASQAGDVNWNAATDVIQTLTVVEACPLANLPADNLQVRAFGETCTDKNNGIISINAGQAQNYIATINSQTYTFTSDLTVADLASGTYPVCVAIAGFTNCEQCFELVIEEAPILNGKTTVNTNGSNAKEVFVDIETGTAPFTVKINDAIIGEYNTKNFTVEAQSGDTVEVSSSRECEGKLSKTIDAFADVTAYPNPTRAGVTLTLPNIGIDTIAVEIHNALGVSVSTRRYAVAGSKAVLPMENLPAGIYFVTIKEGTSKTFKIIKE
ncbi:MBG domain-containing protein [Aquimarina sp. Aq78]|uniref:MBG domain-containing protein n=1 Tax=Aquimarina sp. Aq78 TaxID=1191889 RepID=UPI000D0E784D|nr:MBG domain-containing protein [Aquimarina sp. Aq78]